MLTKGAFTYLFVSILSLAIIQSCSLNRSSKAKITVDRDSKLTDTSIKIAANNGEGTKAGYDSSGIKEIYVTNTLTDVSMFMKEVKIDGDYEIVSTNCPQTTDDKPLPPQAACVFKIKAKRDTKKAGKITFSYGPTLESAGQVTSTMDISPPSSSSSSSNSGGASISGLPADSASSTQVTEGSNYQSDVLSCGDGSVLSVSQVSDSSVTCSIADSALKCAVGYHTGHANWSVAIKVKCTSGDTSAEGSAFLSVTDVNRLPTFASLSAGTTVPGTAITYTATPTDLDGDTVTLTCTVSGSNCSTLANMGYSFNTSTGAFSWTPTGAAAVGGVATNYTLTFTASDGVGTSATTVGVTVNPGVPMTAVTSQTMSGGNPVLAGSAITTIDINNLTSGGAGNDAGTTYACYFDQVVDGTVAATNLCTTLPGTATFNTATGVFNWTPNTAPTTVGQYEIMITANDGTQTGSQVFTMQVVPGYSSSNRPVYYDSFFANGSAAGSGAAGSWSNLGSAAGSATMNNFDNTASSGWVGAGSATNPNAIELDGVDDYIDLGTAINSEADLIFDTWIRPKSPQTRNAVILSNGDANDHGFTLKQADDGTGKLVLNLGADSTYIKEVLADTPVAYYRFNEKRQPYMLDMTQQNGLCNGAATASMNSSGAVLTSDSRALNWSSGNWVMGCSKVAFPTVAPMTLEGWVYFGTAQGAGDEDWLVDWGTGTGGSNILLARKAVTHQLYTQYGGVDYTGPVLNTATWYHVAVVYNSSAPYIQFFVNGVDQTGTISGQPGSAPTGVSNVNYLYIGGSASSNNYANTGSMLQELAVYGSALSSSRILSHYAAGQRPTCRSLSSLAENSWHHVAGVFNNTSKTVTMYINGQSQCSISTSGTFALNGSSNSLLVGRSAAGASTSWKGSIANLRLYNVSGPTTIVTGNYTASKGLYNYSVPLSSLRSWFRADAMPNATANKLSYYIFNGGGNMTDIVPNTGTMPPMNLTGIGGKPAWDFTSGTKCISGGAAPDYMYDYTVMAVFKAVGTGAVSDERIFEVDGHISLRRSGTTADTLSAFIVSDSPAPTVTAVDGVAHVMTMMRTGTTRTVYIDGTLLNTSAASGAQTDGFWSTHNIGCIGGNNKFTGHIAEAIIFNSAITATERIGTETYLKGKYGIP